MSSKGFTSSLPFKLILALILGILVGLGLNSIEGSAFCTAILNVIVTIRQISGQFLAEGKQQNHFQNAPDAEDDHAETADSQKVLIPPHFDLFHTIPSHWSCLCYQSIINLAFLIRFLSKESELWRFPVILRPRQLLGQR